MATYVGSCFFLPEEELVKRREKKLWVQESEIKEEEYIRVSEIK